MTEIRPLAPGDRPERERLYRGYGDFYRVATSADKLATLFNWITYEMMAATDGHEVR